MIVLRSPLPSAALLSLGLINSTGSPSILTRSQKRAHSSSCAARTIVEADNGVNHDLVPNDDALFGAKSADLTSDSDSASASSVVEEDEPGEKWSRLADEWNESKSDYDSNDDGGDDFRR